MIKHTFSCRSIIENSNNKPSLSGLLFINKKEPLAEFNTFLNPALEHIFKTINKQIILLRNQQKNISIEKDNLLNIIINDLHKKLQEMTMRCLVVHINQIENQLSGDTKKERLDFFIKFMQEKHAINNFFNKYPVLEYRLDILLNNYLSAKILFFKSFYSNFNRICKLLNKEPNCQCSIEHTEIIGDSHNRGKSVTEVRLNFESITKKIIYKPRGSGILKTYEEYCSQFNAYSTLKISPIKSISSGESCWVEFINFNSCDSEDQVKKYYEGLGCLLANMFFLRGIDVHFENIIACFGMPYLVDHECLFSPALTKGQEVISLDDTLIIRSTFEKNNKISRFDASAFGRSKEQTLSIKSLSFELDAEEYVRFSKNTIKIYPQKNIPKLQSEFVNPEKYTEEFLEGFKIGYCCIMRLKENIEGNLPALLKFKTNKVRVLIKPTLFYRKLLQESFHPLLLMDQKSAIDFLRNQLSRQSIYHSYIDSEIKQLINGDIPYFSYSPKNSAIVGGNKIVGIPERLAFDCIKKQVNKFSLIDLEYHLNKIRGSIST